MNFLEHPYPSSMQDIIEKSEQNINLLVEKLNYKNCSSLNDLYKVDSEGDVVRNKIEFDKMNLTLNSMLNTNSKSNNELKGLYLFGEVGEDNKVVPVYIGISRTIFRRLRQHGWGKVSNHASLAKLMSEDKNDLLPSKEIIKKYKVAIVTENFDYDLYFMEVYIAGKLKTKWNNFRTH